MVSRYCFTTPPTEADLSHAFGWLFSSTVLTLTSPAENAVLALVFSGDKIDKAYLLNIQQSTPWRPICCVALHYRRQFFHCNSRPGTHIAEAFSVFRVPFKMTWMRYESPNCETTHGFCAARQYGTCHRRIGDLVFSDYSRPAGDSWFLIMTCFHPTGQVKASQAC